jgi:hypothetical protein
MPLCLLQTRLGVCVCRWGNPQTISWEPHLERTLASGQELRWTIEYEFGGGIKL